MQGKLISFEGPEGGGKSTQAKVLAEKLRGRGMDVLTTREPGGTPTGELIRNILQHNASGEPLCDEAEALLFCASRAQLCKNVLAPALARNTWIVCDRFTDSTLAYQGYGRGFNVEMLRHMNDFATGTVKPAVTLLLDLPAEAGLQRVCCRSAGCAKDRIESESIDFHNRLRDGYLELARIEPDRFVIVDATRSSEEVADEVWRIVRKLLPAELRD